MATTDRREPLCAAWRRPVPAPLVEAFAAGERAVHRALELVDVVEVPVGRVDRLDLDPRVGLAPVGRRHKRDRTPC